jgi:hypothetical protein
VLKDYSNSVNKDSAVSRYGRAAHYATITLLRCLSRLARYLLGREKDQLPGPGCLCVITHSVADEPSITKLPGSFSERPRRDLPIGAECDVNEEGEGDRFSRTIINYE